MNFAPATRELSFRDRALHAAAIAKLSSFADAYEPNPTHANQVNATFAKTCSPLTRFATLCDTNVVKQLAFVMPNFYMQVMSCPFPAQGRNNEEVFAGSLGDSMEVFCPVTIRMKDVRGDLFSICETRAEANSLNLPTSESNPLEEEAPPNEDEFVEVEVAGPDRIGIDLNVATKEPCFVAIPKVIPVAGGEKDYSEFKESLITTQAMPSVLPGSMQAVWYEAMRYGIRKLDNLSLQAKDVLFRYENLGKVEFETTNRAPVSRFTTIVTYLTPEDPLYHEVIKRVLGEKEKAMLTFGAKILESTPLKPAPATSNVGTTSTAGMTASIPSPADSGISALLDGLAKAISDTSSKTLTGTERDKASEAEDAKRFYSILFGSVHQTIQEDGTYIPTFAQATIHPLFMPVLTANKNSKATRAMQEAVESMAAELSLQDGCFASSSNLVPKMFDQPLTAALRTGQWENQHTVLNPDGIKTNFGLHHLAPPRTNSATYITRQQGELQLTQQEQVEEDQSRYNAKATDLYHFGYMGTIFEIQEMVGNLFGLMCTIIEFNEANPPLIWTEVAKFMKILRTNDGRRFAARHRNIPEVMFNVGQEIQSIIVGYVSEARKTNYKAAIKAGNDISPLIFDIAQQQAAELRSRFTLAVLAANAGHYKDVSAIFKLFQPEPSKEELNRRKREATNEANGNTTARNRPFSSSGNRSTGSPNQHASTVTPNGSPASGPIPNLPGKTVFVHANPAPQKLPHPGAIFPHPTRENKFTILCCRSAYDGRTCTIPTCAFYHFPKQLNQVPRDLKTKLKEWVTNHNLVTWHADVASQLGKPTR
ncbi:hypothetical protein MHU86_2556 [Fragilaria crotonensis]|nr:hypothetical protein MHU86_2556 [Fragilaria crotonensis]